MSALGHFIEEEGIATAGISLVREHTAQMRPPRSLWVPFELGRPLGAPNDPAFQRRVLKAALALLCHPGPSPVLEDFPDDAPDAAPGAEEAAAPLVCPVNLPPPPSDDSPLQAALIEEIGRLAPWYQLAVETRGRTTVGVSGLDIDRAARFAASLLDAEAENPCPDLTLAETCKLACEDLKAYYAEAATAQPGAQSSSRAVSDWFWGETTAGKLFFDLQAVCAAHPDAEMRLLASNFFVPRDQAHRKPRGAD